MNILRLAATAALLVSASSALAQTETEEEQMVFVEVVDSNVQLPLTFAAAACGLPVEQVTTDFVGTTDAACAIEEELATQVGLVDERGELVDLSRQGFVNVQLPDNETRVQMPVGLAAQICEVQESELAEHSTSVRLVACELTQEQVEASGLPGLLASLREADDAAEQEGTDEGDAGASQPDADLDNEEDNSGSGG
jgi:hypothetical protein